MARRTGCSIEEKLTAVAPIHTKSENPLLVRVLLRRTDPLLGRVPNPNSFGFGRTRRSEQAGRCLDVNNMDYRIIATGQADVCPSSSFCVL